MTTWNQGGVTRVRLRRRVSLAVLAIDDFTGRPITSANLSVSAEQLVGKPVRKRDGYFLFLDSPVPVLDVTARAWAYHPATVRVELSGLNPLRPVVKLRLTPNRNYSIPMHTTCLEGTAPPHCLIRVFCENDPRPLRLLYDYQRKDGEGGRMLRLYDPRQEDLGGRSFALLRRGEEEPECFTVREMAEGEEGACLLASPLARDCKKAGTTVLPISAVQADEGGRFFLPLRALAVKTCVCRVLWAGPDGKAHTLSIELEPGRVTRLDLTENLFQSD